MKKDKITILVLGFISLLIIGFAFYNSAQAAESLIYVSPANLTKNVGDLFDLSVRVNSSGEKVCAVEGNLNLDKLSCQNITVDEGIMAQSSPSCNNLYFLLGIPGCTTDSKVLFIITTKAGSAGIGTANFSGVDIIGEGVSVSSASAGGSYTLVSPVTPPVCSCASWQDQTCGAGDCSSDQLLQTRVCTPSGCDSESQCNSDQSCSQSPSPETTGSVPATPTPPVCSCASWQDQTCGAGDCSSDQLLQTRVCTPSGCDSESQCNSDQSCSQSPSPETTGSVLSATTSDGTLEGKTSRVNLTGSIFLIIIGILCAAGLIFIGAKKFKIVRREK